METGRWCCSTLGVWTNLESWKVFGLFDVFFLLCVCANAFQERLVVKDKWMFTVVELGYHVNLVWCVIDACSIFHWMTTEHFINWLLTVKLHGNLLNRVCRCQVYTLLITFKFRIHSLFLCIYIIYCWIQYIQQKIQGQHSTLPVISTISLQQREGIDNNEKMP